MPDVHVDQVFVTDPARPPHRLDQLGAGEDHAGITREGGEDVEFGAGQRDRLPGDVDLRGR